MKMENTEWEENAVIFPKHHSELRTAGSQLQTMEAETEKK